MKRANAYYIITVRSAEEEGLQGNVPMVILEINETCGPRDILQLGQVESMKPHWGRNFSCCQGWRKLSVHARPQLLTSKASQQLFHKGLNFLVTFVIEIEG